MRHSLLKYCLTIISCFIAIFCSAQKNIPATDTFYISGDIMLEKSVTLGDLSIYPSEGIPYVIITSHTGAVKDTLVKFKGVLLKTILSDIEISSESPTVLNEYYITLIALDGYTVVYSWNEIFNSGTGEYVYVIVEKDGKPLHLLEDRIAVVCVSDFQTGRRYVKGLERITIHKTE